MADSFGALGQIDAGGRTHAIARLDALAGETDITRLPYTLRVLLENVLRAEALGQGSEDEVRAVARWDARAEPSEEISFRPRWPFAGFTGVPASSTWPPCGGMSRGRRAAQSTRRFRRARVTTRCRWTLSLAHGHLPHT